MLAWFCSWFCFKGTSVTPVLNSLQSKLGWHGRQTVLELLWEELMCTMNVYTTGEEWSSQTKIKMLLNCFKEDIALTFKVVLGKSLNFQYSTLSYCGSIALSILLPIAEFNYCCTYGNTYQTRKAAHEFHQFHIKWSKCRDAGLWRECGELLNRALHNCLYVSFLSLSGSMNFSMHEKMQENWRKAKNWGK